MSQSREEWKFLGKGGFNRVWLSPDRRLVFKERKPKHKDAKTDSPRRCVELFNIINDPYLSDTEQAFVSEHGNGWFSPYIDGGEASNEEIFHALIDIYNRTGRIVLDATLPGNFRKKGDKVICVDVGVAVQLETRNKSFPELTRCRSEASLEYVNNFKEPFLLESFYKEILTKSADSPKIIDPKIINLLKALIVIKLNRPDIMDVDFLKSNPDLIALLAEGFDLNNHDKAIVSLDRVLGVKEKDTQKEHELIVLPVKTLPEVKTTVEENKYSSESRKTNFVHAQNPHGLFQQKIESKRRNKTSDIREHANVGVVSKIPAKKKKKYRRHSAHAFTYL